MDIILYTKSESLITHLTLNLKFACEVRTELSPRSNSKQIQLLHISAFQQTDAINWLRNQAAAGCVIAVCADRPDLTQMLASVQAGSKAYCNSYMQTGLYQQMLQALETGQSWFPPEMLAQTFTLAQTALKVEKNPAQLEALTERENEIARAVADGLSNRQIAERCDISERTVKAHLTNIFKKLEIKDRVALVLHFK
jgi:two-component system, NarL family, nitrate/nitrite response regulator NarL